MTTPSSLAATLGDRYRIERELGQGGMATVYLAHDVKHERKVAIKVLRPELAAIIGVQRFLREIATIAALQHPHILGLIDSGEVTGTAWYVMPYVDGESLRTRLEREKQLAIPEALRIATQVAEALDYAHRQGVIHRDIKPENILLHEGSALIVDFGIALAVSVAGGTRMTETGMSLGTPHYMSPEQAMGQREITARSDVYALGATLYEMLVGDPPFTGSTAQAVVAKVLTEDPVPPSAQRQTVPPHVEEAVLTALQKIPADRQASAAAFAAALANESVPAGGTRRFRPRTAARRSRVRQVAAAFGGLLALAAAFWLGYQVAGLRGTAPVAFGQFTQVTSNPGLEVHPALSPDGQFVAYAAGTSAQLKVFVRPVAGGRAIPLTDTEGVNETEPRWSPDGTRLLFLTRNGVFSAAASGGSLRPEVPAPRGAAIASAAWSPDGRSIAWVAGDTLSIQEPGGSQRRLAVFSEPTSCSWSPTGALIACASGNIMYASAGPNFGNLLPTPIVVVRVSDGGLTGVTDSLSMNSSPAWSPDGRWLYFVSNRDGPLDVYVTAISSRGVTQGKPTRLTTGLRSQSISLSADGRRLAFAEYTATGNVWSLPFEPGRQHGASAALTQLTRGNHVTETVRTSRDGRWLVFDMNQGQNSDLYRMPAAGGEPERLTDSPAEDFGPDLSPDGQELVFHSWRTGSRDLFVMPLDGGPTEQLTRTPLQEALVRWSPDGQALVYAELTAGGGIWVVRRGEDGHWDTPARRTASGSTPSWSPDGTRLAFSEALAGGGLYVMDVDSGPARLVVDPGKGQPRAEWPEWSADGREIYFKSHDARGTASIWAVSRAGGAPRMLVRFDDPSRPSYRPSWSWRGGWAYVTIEDRQSDIWVVQMTTE